jgi:hypothetical protein
MHQSHDKRQTARKPLGSTLYQSHNKDKDITRYLFT